MFKSKMDMLLKIITLPLTSLEFYKKDYIEALSKTTSYLEYEKICREETESVIYSEIRKFNSIYNLDHVNLLVRKFYSQHSIQNKTIGEIYNQMLGELAKAFICHRDGRIALKYWESEDEEVFLGPYKGINKIALWNSLNRMINTDIIVIKYLLDNNMDNVEYLNGYYSSIMLEDLQLDKILNKGVAETHIHKGAGINFRISWTHLMNTAELKSGDFKEHLFIDKIHFNNENIAHYVKIIALARLIMAHFLKERNIEEYYFIEYLNSYYPEINIKESGNDVGKKRDNEIRKLLFSIYDGKEISDMSIQQLQLPKLWERIKGKYFIKEGIEYKAEDKLKFIFEDEKENILTSYENIFLFKSLEYIGKTKDQLFEKIFFQYIRIKNVVFQLKTEINSIKGLDYFTDYYNRSTEITCYSSKEYWKTIIENQLQDKHLKKLELRTSIPKEKIKAGIIKTLKSFLAAYKEIIDESKENNILIPRIGLIFHLIKEKDQFGYDKCWQNYDNLSKEELYYFNLNRLYEKQIKALIDIRESIAGMDKYILGIDAASIENNTEPWVFTSAYKIARGSQHSKTIYRPSLRNIQNLGFTFHVGEEFRHILSGLRRIDEVIEFFKYHAGDRIGHGIALGVNIDEWASNNKVTIIPRGEMLDNLLWVWGFFNEKKILNVINIPRLERSIIALSEQIYGSMEGVKIYTLWRIYRRKFEDNSDSYERIQKMISNKSDQAKIFCQYIKGDYSKKWTEDTLFFSMHCKCYLEKMLEPILVEIVNEDVELFKELQKSLIRKISVHGIYVETNPTSNLTIGEVENIFEHYIFSLNKLDNKGLQENVMVTINSDDPSVFNTNLSSELSYMFYALQEKGYSREDSLRWIDKVREFGMQSSFIQDNDIDDIEKHIYNVLEELKKI